MASNETSHEHPNSTEDTYHFHGYGLIVPLSMLMIAFIILAVVGNIMVILTIVRHRGMRTRTNMFIVNLAVADILVALLDMPFSLTTVISGDWILSHAFCQFNGFTMALFLICSIHTLMYISIHKYISITRPFSRAMTPRRIKMMIAAAWIWSLICAVGPLLKWNKIKYKTGASQCGPAIPDTLSAIAHSLFITTSNYIIPLVVMCFCYYRIFREIHDHMNRIRETSNIDLESSVAQQKKVSVTLFWVLACFVICWTPFVVYSSTLVFMKDKSKMPLIVNPLAYWCGYMNSACNPIIYAFRSPSFRQGYREIMCGDTSRLSTANSLSFRSRSGRGSSRSNSHFKASKSHLSQRETLQKQDEHNRRPRKMLSQTSWISLPLIPYLIRSLSRSNGSSTHRVNRQISESKKSGKPESQLSASGESSRDARISDADEFSDAKTQRGKKKRNGDLERKESFNYTCEDHQMREDEKPQEYIELDVIPENEECQNKWYVSENGKLTHNEMPLEKSCSQNEIEESSSESEMEDTELQRSNSGNSFSIYDFKNEESPQV